MIVLCPKCKKHNLLIGPPEPVQQSVTKMDIMDELYFHSVKSEGFVYTADCSCGFNGSLAESNKIVLISNERPKKV